MTKPDIAFENDYQQKIMAQTFRAPFHVDSVSAVQAWRAAWTQALSTWHSPYKALIDVTNVTIDDSPDIRQSLGVMLKFFEGFFLRKVVGYGFDQTKGHSLLPFPVESDVDAGYAAIGVRTRVATSGGDFRSQVQIQNHFRSHCMEVGFGEPVNVDSDEKVKILRDKITNNLMQWHSKWNLLFDCTNLDIATGQHAAFNRMLKVFSGFHMKMAIGYSPRAAKESYPFPVYRARHRAAAVLESEGASSGDEADCNSKRV